MTVEHNARYSVSPIDSASWVSSARLLDGSGLVFDGKAYRSARGIASEFGRIVFKQDDDDMKYRRGGRS
jgi:hypothetical protein